MGWLQVMMLLPLILQLVRGIEDVIAGAKQGELRKTAVMAALGAVLQAMVSVGSLKADQVGEITSILSAVVDQVVGFLNGLGVLGTKS